MAKKQIRITIDFDDGDKFVVHDLETLVVTDLPHRIETLQNNLLEFEQDITYDYTWDDPKDLTATATETPEEAGIRAGTHIRIDGKIFKISTKVGSGG